MNAIVFLGPSLPLADARAILETDFRPPAAQGDVLRAVQDKPEVIALIDGHFDHVPAVWHKEILWAMQQGIAVYGAASMGALRAAELHLFGMTGMGRIFDDYRDGRIEDDSEVAVAHASAEYGYRPASLALVNVRYSLAAAVAASIISAAAGARLEAAAAAMFYPDRTLAAWLQRAAAHPEDAAVCAALERWWPLGHVDQKRADAIALLQHLAGGHRAVASTNFEFAHTTHWQQLLDTSWADAPARPGHAAPVRVMDELWLEPKTLIRLYTKPMSALWEALRRSGTYEALNRRALVRRASEGATEWNEDDPAWEDTCAEAVAAWDVAHIPLRGDPVHRQFVALVREHWDEFTRALTRAQGRPQFRA